MGLYIPGSQCVTNPFPIKVLSRSLSFDIRAKRGDEEGRKEHAYGYSFCVKLWGSLHGDSLFRVREKDYGVEERWHFREALEEIGLLHCFYCYIVQMNY